MTLQEMRLAAGQAADAAETRETSAPEAGGKAPTLPPPLLGVGVHASPSSCC